MYSQYFKLPLKVITGLILSVLLVFSCVADDIKITFIGQQVIPHKYDYENTVVGGLSSLDYDPETDSYVAICDDRSDKNPARFYGLKLDYGLSGFHSLQVTDVTFIKRSDGDTFPKPHFFGKTYVDPEAMKFSPAKNSYFWTSEGHSEYGVNPFIREMASDGSYLRDFTLPEKYWVSKTKGIRDNLAFEALTVTIDQKSILVSTEGPLIQDGEEADVDRGADIRLLQLDIAMGKPTHEYVYSLEPVHKETLPIGNFSVNGMVDILALSKHEYITVERSFSVGAGLSVRLYLVNLAGASDVLSMDSLKGASYQTVKKSLLIDLGTLGISIDNIEGMTFGRTLKDGRRSLILISDDNFRSAQETQILAFAVSGLD